MFRFKLLSVLLLFIFSLMTVSAGAPIKVTVNMTDDGADGNPGDGFCDSMPLIRGFQCTLRAAIMEANQHLDGSVITVPAGTYNFEFGDEGDFNGDLDIRKDMTIKGGGFRRTTIDPNDWDRAFEVHDGATLNLSGVTITDSFALSGDNPDGGAILVNGSGMINLNGVVIRQNNAANGAGIAFRSIEGGWTSNISNSAFYQNSASDKGGAIAVLSGEMYVHLSNVTISTNSATNMGGGIYEVYSFYGTVNISDSTIAFNSVNLTDGAGGGFYTDEIANIERSIITKNTGFTGPDCSGGIYSETRVLMSNDAGCDTSLANVIENNASLLQPINTYEYIHRLRPDNTFPLMDAIDAGDVDCPAKDQTGMPRRVFRDECDLGAVEYIPSYSGVTGTGDFETFDGSNPNLPYGWSVSGVTKPIYCNNTNPAYTVSMNCAARFVGASGKVSQLFTDVSGWFEDARPGDAAVLEAYVKGEAAVKGGVMIASIVYENGSTASIKINVPVGTYDYRQFTKHLVLLGYTSKVKITLKYAGASGKVYFDDVQLWHYDNSILREAWLPLPPAP